MKTSHSNSVKINKIKRIKKKEIPEVIPLKSYEESGGGLDCPLVTATKD